MNDGRSPDHKKAKGKDKEKKHSKEHHSVRNI